MCVTVSFHKAEEGFGQGLLSATVWYLQSSLTVIPNDRLIGSREACSLIKGLIRCHKCRTKGILNRFVLFSPKQSNITADFYIL